MLFPFPLIYRLGGNGGVICGLINRGRNGGDRYGGAWGLRDTEQFSSEGTTPGSGSSPQDYFLGFFMHELEVEIISVIMNDDNLNIYLCFMITFWTIQLFFTNHIPGNWTRTLETRSRTLCTYWKYFFRSSFLFLEKQTNKILNK